MDMGIKALRLGEGIVVTKSFEEIKLEPYVVGMKRACRESQCQKCIRDVYTKPSIGQRME